jgi:hypothetical protein
MSHEFDLILSAVQRGTESAGFVAVRWSGMPGFLATTKEAAPKSPKPVSVSVNWTAGGQSVALSVEGGTPARHDTQWPAGVLCNPTPSTKNKKNRLLLLLVSESPTWGVDKARLTEAVNLAKQYKALHKEDTDPATKPFRLVGPNYSGSYRSIVDTLKPLIPPRLNPRDPPDFVVYNGNSISPNLDVLAELPAGSLRFKSTVFSNKTLEHEIYSYVNRLAQLAGPPRIAMLLESNTGFGQASGPIRELEQRSKAPARAKLVDYYAFPLNISQIREEYTARGFTQSNEPMKLASPDRLSPLEMVGRRGSRDLIPTVTPGPSAVAGELILSQILLELERKDYQWIGIVATNSYDGLFLAQKVRRSCPDARLFSTSSSALYTHHTSVPYLRGMLVASTYPLALGSQEWIASPGNQGGGELTRVGFGSYLEEGVYNATVAHLAELKLDDTPNFLDYGVPGDMDCSGSHPPVWISVVGQRQLYPLTVADNHDEAPAKGRPELGGLYTNAKPASPSSVSLDSLIDQSWVSVLLTLAIGTFGVALWYLWVFPHPSVKEKMKSRFERVSRWLRASRGFIERWFERVSKWLRVSEGLIERFEHPAARRLAVLTASAGLGQLIMLSAPLCALPHWGNYRFYLIAPITLVAALVVVGAFVTALFHLWKPNRDGNQGDGNQGDAELGYCKVVTLVSGVQIVLVLSYVLFLRFGWSTADRSLYCARATRMVSGVTPFVPILLIGLAGAVVMLGDWRRIGLRVRLGAVLKNPGTSSGPLRQVRQEFKSAHESLEGPHRSWPLAGLWAAGVLGGMGLVLLVILCLGELPGVVEPQGWFRPLFLLAYGITLGLLAIRLIDTIGISRALDRLLRRLAELPMVRAFDRVPTELARENIWRPASNRFRAGDDSDPRIDRQFKAVMVGYKRFRDAIDNDKCLWLVDRSALDTLRRWTDRQGPDPKLPTQKWWEAVDALSPLLDRLWASRAMIAPSGTKDADDRIKLDKDGAGLQSWLTSCEDLIAMIMTRQFAWLRAAIDSIIGFLVAGLILATLVLNSYPFEPNVSMKVLIGSLTVVTVGAIVVIAIQASRDEVLSRLNKTPADRFTFDRQFFATMITSIVPLLGLLGTLSYSLSDLFRSLLEPFLRGG